LFKANRGEHFTKGSALGRPVGIRFVADLCQLIAFQTFTAIALAEGKIQDEFVDQHFITEFLLYSSQRAKMNTKGVDMPGTRVGSVSELKSFPIRSPALLTNGHACYLYTGSTQEAFLREFEIPHGADSVAGQWSILRGR
jgi:hypothetical protein